MANEIAPLDQEKVHTLIEIMKSNLYVAFLLLQTLGLFLVLSLQSVRAQPLPPLPVPHNASHVAATVLAYTVWPPGSLRDDIPPVTSDDALYSVTVKIHTSEPYRSDLEYLAVPGTTYEAFSSAAVGSDFVAKKDRRNIDVDW